MIATDTRHRSNLLLERSLILRHRPLANKAETDQSPPADFDMDADRRRVKMPGRGVAQDAACSEFVKVPVARSHSESPIDRRRART
jgi:hypothetical protein